MLIWRWNKDAFFLEAICHICIARKKKPIKFVYTSKSRKMLCHAWFRFGGFHLTCSPIEFIKTIIKSVQKKIGREWWIAIDRRVIPNNLFLSRSPIPFSSSASFTVNSTVVLDTVAIFSRDFLQWTSVKVIVIECKYDVCKH